MPANNRSFACTILGFACVRREHFRIGEKNPRTATGAPAIPVRQLGYMGVIFTINLYAPDMGFLPPSSFPLRPFPEPTKDTEKTLVQVASLHFERKERIGARINFGSPPILCSALNDKDTPKNVCPCSRAN